MQVEGLCAKMATWNKERQHNTLHKKNLIRLVCGTYYLEENLLVRMLQDGLYQSQLHKSSPDSDFADSKNVSIFTFPHCGLMCMCERE
jgi:hypothetical protein